MAKKYFPHQEYGKERERYLTFEEEEKEKQTKKRSKGSREKTKQI